MEIPEEAYQHYLHPDISSVYCALASHFRVLYYHAGDEHTAASKFLKARDLFEASIMNCNLPTDFTVSEYAAFLFDAGKYDEAASQLAQPHELLDMPYNHFVEGHGYLQVKLKYFMLWVKFKLVLVRGEPADHIIHQYAAMLEEDEEDWEEEGQSEDEEDWEEEEQSEDEEIDHEEDEHVEKDGEKEVEGGELCDSFSELLTVVSSNHSLPIFTSVCSLAEEHIRRFNERKIELETIYSSTDDFDMIRWMQKMNFDGTEESVTKCKKESDTSQPDLQLLQFMREKISNN